MYPRSTCHGPSQAISAVDRRPEPAPPGRYTPGSIADRAELGPQLEPGHGPPPTPWVPPGRGHPAHERPCGPCPLRPPGQRHALPNPPPSLSAHPHFPVRPPLAESGGPQAGHMSARSAQASACQAGTCRQRGPSVAVRGKADGLTDRPDGTGASAIHPWTRDTQHPPAVQGDTQRHEEETARLARQRS